MFHNTANSGSSSGITFKRKLESEDGKEADADADMFEISVGELVENNTVKALLAKFAESAAMKAERQRI